MTESTKTRGDLRRNAREVFLAGVEAADPFVAVRNHLSDPRRLPRSIAGREIESASNLRIVAIGKAACAMARAASEHFESGWKVPGIIVVNDENRKDVEGFAVHPSGHPVPDARGVRAAEAIRKYVSSSVENDSLLVLISGGGSALLPAPAPGITLEDKMETTRLLLSCGADIHELNTVRKHLSSLKGGGLARAASPSRIETLILSDVIGDDLSTIASGPTVADPTTFADAREVLEKYSLMAAIPAEVAARIDAGTLGDIAETPTPGDPLFATWSGNCSIIGSNTISLQAALAKAEALGYGARIASSALCGDASAAGWSLARQLEDRTATRASPQKARAILAGGETTVVVRGTGRGGRNQELALAFALQAASLAASGWVFLSGGTDGRDGPTDAAGAIVDPGSLGRGSAAGFDVHAELTNNNSYEFLKASGDLLHTGGTGTNVADLQILLIA